MSTLWTIVMLFGLIAIAVAGGWFAWTRLSGGNASLFGGGREARIGVIEIVSLDSKRKLVLIRRDGVEHLIMTGGPIDVVIEDGIQPQRRVAPLPAAQPAAAAASFEPRFNATASPLTADPTPESAANFGRLRQRAPQPQVAEEPYQRSERPGVASGSRNR